MGGLAGDGDRPFGLDSCLGLVICFSGLLRVSSIDFLRDCDCEDGFSGLFSSLPVGDGLDRENRLLMLAGLLELAEPRLRRFRFGDVLLSFIRKSYTLCPFSNRGFILLRFWESKDRMFIFYPPNRFVFLKGCLSCFY